MLLLLGACTGPTIKIGDVYLPVEIADSVEEHKTGLMGRDVLDGGMLFVFDEEKTQHFWMKNMNFFIDILFFDKKKKFINAYEKVPPCKTEPCSIYTSHAPAQYALEVPPGFTKIHKLQPGDMFIIV